MLLNQEQAGIVAPTTRVLQIITGAMVTSVFVFGAIAAAMTDWADVKDGFSFLASIALFVAITMVVVSFILPRLLNSGVADVLAHQLKNKGEKQVGESAIKKFAGQFQSSHVVRLACIEGAAFLNVVVFFIDKHWISLAVAAFCLFMILLCFPLHGRVIGWIENQVRIVDEQLR